MKSRTFLALTAMLALAVVSHAWAKPDFSGTWKMNASKSDFGPIPAPDKMERTIKHADPTLTMSTVQSGQQGELKTEITYKTDGSESVNKIRGNDVKSVAQWKGSALTVTSKREMQGAEITQAETWTLSEDGKTLTINNKITAPQGEFELKLVMDKQ